MTSPAMWPRAGRLCLDVPASPLGLPASFIKEAIQGELPCDSSAVVAGILGSETLCSQLVTGEQRLRLRREIPGAHNYTFCCHSVFSLAPSLLCVQISAPCLHLSTCYTSRPGMASSWLLAFLGEHAWLFPCVSEKLRAAIMKKIKWATKEERGLLLLPATLCLKVYFIRGREMAHD